MHEPSVKERASQNAPVLMMYEHRRFLECAHFVHAVHTSAATKGRHDPRPGYKDFPYERQHVDDNENAGDHWWCTVTSPARSSDIACFLPLMPIVIGPPSGAFSTTAISTPGRKPISA